MLNSIDRRYLSIVLSEVSSNVTVWLNEARLIVKQCSMVKQTVPIRNAEFWINETK